MENKEELLAEFYIARQLEDEDVTTWSRRLEDIIGKGLEKGIVPHTEVNSMLRSMLYTGVRQDLKDITGYKYDTIQSFNQLRVALRQIEREHQPMKSTTKPNTTKAALNPPTPERNDIEELKGMVYQLTHQVNQLQQQPMQQQYNRGRGNYRGQGNYSGFARSRPPNWQRQPAQNGQQQQPPTWQQQPPSWPQQQPTYRQ